MRGIGVLGDWEWLGKAEVEDGVGDGVGRSCTLVYDLSVLLRLNVFRCYL